MTIEGHQKNIRDLIMGDNMSFHIPIYQRTYTWQARVEVDKLIDDIVEFAEEHEGNSKADYYIGNIIVKNQTRGFVTERVVIDGQQRITTTILILCAIRDLYLSKIKTENALESARAICRALFSQEGNHIRIKLNNMEHQRTLNTLLSGELLTIDLVDRSTNYWKNYNHIVRRFETWNEHHLQRFVDILERVKVVVIFLDEDQDENSVFESINSSGKRLSGSDLIKNFIFTFKRFQVTHYEEKQLIELYTIRFLVLVENLGQNEVISFDTGLKGCQIEHIMPQTLNGHWSGIPEATHQQYIHTLGNLSITFDNQGLSNKGFSEKKKLLAEKSRIRLNQMLLDYEVFDESAIKDRAHRILEKFFRGYCIERSSSDSNFEPIPAEIIPKVWLESVRLTNDASDLKDLNNPQSWKSICDFLEIDVGQDSAHRRLEQWRQRNKPEWPSTF